MALKYVSLGDIDRVTFLIIGRAGIGKTSLLRTIDPSESVCVLSAESGLLSVRDLAETERDFLVIEISSIDDFKEALATLKSDEWKERYRWVFIDSLTEIAARCTEDFKRRYPDKKDSFNLWGGYTETMEGLIKSFRDLSPYCVVFTCLETVEYDEVKRRYISPDLSGRQIKERLTSYFDEVFYMTDEPGEGGASRRIFFTQPRPGLPGKDRSGKLDEVEVPDLAKIKKKILSCRV